jgi:hypothetical protein
MDNDPWLASSKNILVITSIISLDSYSFIFDLIINIRQRFNDEPVQFLYMDFNKGSTNKDPGKFSIS